MKNTVVRVDQCAPGTRAMDVRTGREIVILHVTDRMVVVRYSGLFDRQSMAPDTLVIVAGAR